jgi:hypothetical protein
MSPELINIILGLLGSLFGGGIVYGVIKERLHGMDEKHKTNDDMHKEITMTFQRVVFKDSHDGCISGTKALLASMDGKLDMLIKSRLNREE